MSNQVRKRITVINRLGLHARAAAKLVTRAAAFESDIRVSKDGREVNAKSIMGVMMLAVGMGSEIDIVAEGDDAQLAVTALEDLINDRFGETE